MMLLRQMPRISFAKFSPYPHRRQTGGLHESQIRPNGRLRFGGAGLGPYFIDSNHSWVGGTASALVGPDHLDIMIPVATGIS